MLVFRTGKSYWIGVIIGVKDGKCQKTPKAFIGEGCSA